jgi:hypothetical protein
VQVPVKCQKILKKELFLNYFRCTNAVVWMVLKLKYQAGRNKTKDIPALF